MALMGAKMGLDEGAGTVSMREAPEVTPEQGIVMQLREQIKIIEDEKAAAHRKRVFQEEAESLRKQIRSYGLTPVA